MPRLLLVVFFLFAQASFSQTITGLVREKGSGLPLPFANVFINNSTIGATTNAEGKFSITGKIPPEFDLVVSFVGYRTISKFIQLKGRNAIYESFELEFIEDNLSEIELKSKRDKNWERNLRIFKDVFLAVPEDPFGRDIEILNPWVLDFEKVRPGKGYGYLKATAQQPLQLVNKALGYQIDYTLQDFRMLRNASRFYGQAFYKELTPEDSVVKKQWEESKGLNYQSSIRHLALSLLLKNAGGEGFELYMANPNIPREERTSDFYYELKKSIIPVNIDLIYIKPLGNGIYRIFLSDRIEVHHLKKPWPNDYYENVYHAISWIQAPSGYFDVDRNGTLMHPSQLALSGFMGRQRMARSLPLDFVPDERYTGLVEEMKLFQSRYILLNDLREKPWITTNKAFYYPGETMWLGGKMLYQNSVKQDTLSRVLYVDILNEKMKAVQQETYPIQNGKISGGLVLSDTLPKGNYLLRAYTRWGLNYEEKDIFEWLFPILNSNEILEKMPGEAEEELGEIKVLAEQSLQDSVSYRVLDLELSILDDFDNPVNGDFVLTATSEGIQEEVEPKYRLGNSLDWLDVDLKENFDSDLSQPVEYGISVMGKYFPNKKRDPLVASITLVKGDLEDYGRVTSDSSGNFWATGFQFQDSAQIAIAALDAKMRPLGTVEIIPWNRPYFRGSFPKSTYQIKTLPQEQERLMDLSGDYILLEEFVKEGEKEQEKLEDRNYGYGEPNQEVGPSDLETKTWAEILGLLRFNMSTLKFRNYTYGEETGSPLLIIDGQSRPFMDSATFRELLLSFEPSQLKSVKAYNDNVSNAVFGMAGYSGVLMIETKNGFRSGPDADMKFNSEAFQVFPIKGYSRFPEFPKNPRADQYLKKKATLYWDPLAKTQEGKLRFQIKVPYGISQLQLKVEGQSEEGETIYQVIPLKIEK